MKGSFTLAPNHWPNWPESVSARQTFVWAPQNDDLLDAIGALGLAGVLLAVLIDCLL